MNFRHFLLTTAILFSLFINAQNDFQIGAKAGVNYSGFNVNGTSSYTDAFGLLAGVIAEYQLSNTFSIQPELIFIQKTGGRETPSNLPGGLIRADLSYIDLPISGKYYFFKGFAVEFGPQLDILINDKTTIAFNNDNSEPNPANIETNAIQLSINLGFSYKIAQKYLVQFRYSHGITHIYKDLDATNSVFALSVGYFFLNK
ncbi:porin family protein [Paucihalobacter sp.]|uniref:porin family protein n=1 Tax=Paucihalobacter sp. TaxID=2850405 RepID=UPI002FDF2E1A